MSLDHKNVVRNNDEFICTACGKSWDATDRDPPECDAVRHRSEPIKNIQNLPWEKVKTNLQRIDPDHLTNLLTNNGQSMTVQGDGTLKRVDPTVNIASHWPTPSDPNRLMERMLVEHANALPLTRADFATVTAWLVSEIGDERRAMLVYAADRHTAQTYAVAVTGRTATMEVRRLGAMDKHGYGRSAYVELNPALLKKASKAAGREVVSLITWRRQA